MKKALLLAAILLLVPLVYAGIQPSIGTWDYESYYHPYTMYFKEDPTEAQVVRFEHEGVYIDFQPMALNYRNDLNQLEQIEMINSVTVSHDSVLDIVYPAAYGQGIDLKYTLFPEKVKEVLLINQSLPAPAAYIISGGNPTLDLDFILSSNAGRIMINGAEWDKSSDVETQDAVNLTDGSGNVIGTLVKPTASDANSDGVNLTYKFRKSGNSLYVTVSTPYSWLSTATYPVQIDPTYDVWDSSINDTLWSHPTCTERCGTICGENNDYIYANSCFVSSPGQSWNSYIETTGNISNIPFYLDMHVNLIGQDDDSGLGDGRAYIAIGGQTIYNANGGQICGPIWCGSHAANFRYIAEARNLSSVLFTMTGTLSGTNNNTLPKYKTVDISSTVNKIKVTTNGANSEADHVDGFGYIYYINYTYYPNVTSASLTSESNRTNKNLIGKCTADDYNEGLNLTYFYTLYYNDVVNLSGTYTDVVPGTEKTVVNITRLTFDEGNYSLACTAQNDDPTTKLLNSTTITTDNLFIQATTPYFEVFPDDQSVYHNYNLSLQINCTNPIGGDIFYFDNTTLFDINASGYIFDNPGLYETGVYDILLSCGDNASNSTDVFQYEIRNTIPTFSNVQFNPDNLDGAQDVYLTHDIFDNESDIVYNYTRWYKNDVYNATWDDQLTIGAENLSDGDKLNVTIWVGDGIYNTTSTYHVVSINDSVVPVLDGISVSSTSVTIDTQGFLYADCSDVASSVQEVKLYLTDPDSLVNTYTLTVPYNGTTYRQAVSFNKLNTWQFTNATCLDSNGNLASNGTVGITITVSESGGNETPTGGGGGGGSKTTIVISGNETVKELLGITCGNAVCDENENPVTCPEDCNVNIDTLLSGETFGQYWFTQAMIFFVFGIIGYFMYRGMKKPSRGKKK